MKIYNDVFDLLPREFGDAVHSALKTASNLNTIFYCAFTSFSFFPPPTPIDYFTCLQNPVNSWVLFGVKHTPGNTKQTVLSPTMFSQITTLKVTGTKLMLGPSRKQVKQWLENFIHLFKILKQIFWQIQRLFFFSLRTRRAAYPDFSIPGPRCMLSLPIGASLDSSGKHCCWYR